MIRKMGLSLILLTFSTHAFAKNACDQYINAMEIKLSNDNQEFNVEIEKMVNAVRQKTAEALKKDPVGVEAKCRKSLDQLNAEQELMKQLNEVMSQ